MYRLQTKLHAYATDTFDPPNYMSEKLHVTSFIRSYPHSHPFNCELCIVLSPVIYSPDPERMESSRPWAAADREGRVRIHARWAVQQGTAARRRLDKAGMGQSSSCAMVCLFFFGPLRQFSLFFKFVAFSFDGEQSASFLLTRFGLPQNHGSEWMFLFPCFVKQAIPFLWNSWLLSSIPNGVWCQQDKRIPFLWNSCEKPLIQIGQFVVIQSSCAVFKIPFILRFRCDRS